MEAPGKGEPQTSLPNFTPLIFTDAFGCWKNNALGDPQNANTVTVQDRSLKALTSVKLESGYVEIDLFYLASGALIYHVGVGCGAVPVIPPGNVAWQRQTMREQGQ